MSFENNPYSSMLHIKDLKKLDQEVRAIVSLMFGEVRFERYERTLADVVALFRGDYPGYRACNTRYHDLIHTLDVLLATARLLHGVHLDMHPLDPREAELTLISAALHDMGYLQETDDMEGTGAKHTIIHVRRGVDFAETYFPRIGLDREAFEDCRSILLCTDLAVPMEAIEFRSDRVRTLGYILGTSDIIGQMADDIYLEKLADLWDEFEEGRVEGFTSEYDLTRKTLGFYAFMEDRLQNTLGNVESHMVAHFKARYGVDRDLYAEYIRKNIDFLAAALEELGRECGAKFKRSKFRNREFLRELRRKRTG